MKRLICVLLVLVPAVHAWPQSASQIPDPKSKAELLDSIAKLSTPAPPSNESGSHADRLLALSLKHAPDETDEDRVRIEFAVLQSALKQRDANFDPSSVRVYLTVPPPEGYDSGIPADRVTDPKQRADYEKRIRENAMLAKKINDHYTIANLIKTTLWGLEHRLKEPGKREDARKARQTVEQLLQESTLSGVDKELIRQKTRLKETSSHSVNENKAP